MRKLEVLNENPDRIDPEIASQIIEDMQAQITELKGQVTELTQQLGVRATGTFYDQDKEGDAIEVPQTVLTSVDSGIQYTSTNKYAGARKPLRKAAKKAARHEFVVSARTKVAAAAVVALALGSSIFGLSGNNTEASHAGASAPVVEESDEDQKNEGMFEGTLDSLKDVFKDADTDSEDSTAEESDEDNDNESFTMRHMNKVIRDLNGTGKITIFEDWDENIADDSVVEAYIGSINTGKTVEAAADGEMTINDTVQISQNTLAGEYGEDRAEDARFAMHAAGFSDEDIEQFMETGSMDNFHTFAVQANEAGIFTDTPYVMANGEVNEHGTRAYTSGDIFLIHVAKDKGSVIVTRIDCGAFMQDGNFNFPAPVVPTPEVPETPEKNTPPPTVPETTTSTSTVPETTTTTEPEEETTTSTSTTTSTTSSTVPETSTTLPDKNPTPPIKDGEDDVEEPVQGPSIPTTSTTPTTVGSETTLPPATTSPTTQPPISTTVPATSSTSVPQPTPPTLPEILFASVADTAEKPGSLAFPAGVVGAIALAIKARKIRNQAIKNMKKA